ncbi:rhamnogalacturonan lyase [Rathayibacter sp. VKM Ac-2856]|uniref:rhamnogalacturonan lyase n=1 Tax=unclassified Rathayibacter TaxID=2609250 RepID=UPI0015661124|nr:MULTISPECIES: rhamnogalacturonan lyase [unclassified Rathayibacter]NQX05377.1 rhamnogalacturonan lyase [Rathayibacter sp. VKM Ac-2858]NQX20748.1 rhamnogalacturonan lyase [Rathayibacter sp. VKM Ac-2856]
MPNSRPFRPPSTAGALRSGLGLALAAGLALTGASTAAAAPQAGSANPVLTAQLEDLDRGVVALASPDGGVFVSWRLLATEVTGSSGTGMIGADFAVYRGAEQVGVVTDSTNLHDPDGTPGDEYRVVPLVDGAPGEPSAPATASADAFETLPLQKPADGVTPAGEAYTYSANDMSVGDMDGDGDYEYVVKWYPSNAKDVSQKGYTGSTYLDTYEADGTLLHRIDLGVNIRSGAHYTQFLVSDFDGDGRSEIMTKTAPGTTVLPGGDPARAQSITLLPEDVAAGVTAEDDYRLSAAGYRDHLIGVFEGWGTREEVTSGQWPATLEEAFGIAPTHAYPLDRDGATELADYFIDVYAPSRSDRNDLTTFEGFILDGPEYLTVFDGESGEELQTAAYEPGRGDDGLLWGDYAYSRIEPGNRVDRFLAGVASFDGETQSAVFARGYYTRAVVVAYDWDGTSLSQRWVADSGHVPLTNPFDDTPHGREGTSPEWATLTTQGFHSLSAADVDGDGRQEIVYGSATLDDDGSLLYSSYDTLPEGSSAPGTEAKLGHGDAMHVTDIDPANPGLEIFSVHEGGVGAPYGYALRDAATGEVLFGAYSGKDTGRGMIGDVDPAIPGQEVWAIGKLSASGEPLTGGDSSQQPGTNQSIRWAADMTTQIVASTTMQDATPVTPTIVTGDGTVLLSAEGTVTNNGTKGNPSLVADVLGDWREELLLPTADSSAIRIYSSTEVTDRKLTTLMHDPQYRVEVARQQTAYNQPSYTSYGLASDIDWSTVPVLAQEGTEPVPSPTPTPAPTGTPVPMPTETAPPVIPAPGDPAPGEPAPHEPAPVAGPDGDLAATGVDLSLLPLGALALLLGGGALLLRRRLQHGE